MVLSFRCLNKNHFLNVSYVRFRAALIQDQEGLFLTQMSEDAIRLGAGRRKSKMAKRAIG